MSAMTIILFVIGLAFLIGGAEALVRGASRLAVAAGVSPLVIGLTVVAFGTSAPELAVSVHSALVGQPDVGLGNVVGSNICNVLLILGAAAAVAPLAVATQLVRFDVWVMIGVSILMLLLALDGRIGRVDGLLLLGGAVTYTVWLIRESRKRRTPQQRPNGAGADLPPRAHRRSWPIDVGLVLIGLTLLTLGARGLVYGAVVFARTLGISELIVGLTIVAVGTSLPELATSVVAAARGERDIAVGNVVGSNIFNVLVVLGLTAAVAPGGVKVTHTALVFDIPVMVVVALACLPIFFTAYRVDRWEGLLFLGYYAAYVVYLALDATRSGALGWYRVGILCFALPLTAYVIAVSVLHGLRRRST
ncbi:MAG TPA: calcium/sodium antiporter [Phycisphaerae bacterium]|nr:calcium/sodium antiporter [Phycisphaerae bacterium]